VPIIVDIFFSPANQVRAHVTFPAFRYRLDSFLFHFIIFPPQIAILLFQRIQWCRSLGKDPGRLERLVKTTKQLAMHDFISVSTRTSDVVTEIPKDVFVVLRSNQALHDFLYPRISE